MKIISINVLLLIAALISFLCGITLGSISIPLADVIHSLYHPTADLTGTIVIHLRLPRVINAFTIGSSLALAGAMLQVLLRNPLADPYILGVSGGSATIALIAILLGISSYYLPICAFIGGVAAMGLVMLLAKNQGQLSINRLLLNGVMLAAGWGALISLLLILNPAQTSHAFLFWLMGDIDYSGIAWPIIFLLLIVLVIYILIGKALNILAYGETTAKTLGVNTQLLQFLLYFLSSLLTAGAVSYSGCIGFVGLVVPHLLRLIGIRDQRLLAIGCFLLGGSLLTIADCVARTVIAPAQLPVGIITVMLGVPFFLSLLHKS